MNLSNDIHAFDYVAERREALTIQVSLPAEVQFRLIAYAD